MCIQGWLHTFWGADLEGLLALASTKFLGRRSPLSGSIDWLPRFILRCLRSLFLQPRAAERWCYTNLLCYNPDECIRLQRLARLRALYSRDATAAAGFYIYRLSVWAGDESHLLHPSFLTSWLDLMPQNGHWSLREQHVLLQNHDFHHRLPLLWSVNFYTSVATSHPEFVII